MLCTIELNRSRPIAEDPSSASFVRDIEDWSRICGNIYLWDYTVNFSHHVSPFPNLHVLQPNIRFFVDHGVRKHFQQTNTGPGHEWSELKSYLLARLLWDPRTDVDAVMDDFLDGYYGKAGPFVRRYIDALRAALERSGAKLDIYEPPAVHAEAHLSAADVALYDKLFDKAEAAAAGDREILARVKTARLPLMYAKLEIGKDDMFGAARLLRGEGRPVRGPTGHGPPPRGLRPRCRAGGVRTLNEAGLTPAAYYDAVKRFIDVQVDGNLAFRRPVAADPPPASKYARGDLAVLTNGVRGAADFKVHWLGWEGVDFALTLDLGRPVPAREITISTLSDARSWILHPETVACSVSADGATFREVGTSAAAGDHQGEEVVRAFTWTDDGDRARAPSPRSASSASGSKGRSGCPPGTPRPAGFPGSSSTRSSSADPSLRLGSGYASCSPAPREPVVRFPPAGPPSTDGDRRGNILRRLERESRRGEKKQKKRPSGIMDRRD